MSFLEAAKNCHNKSAQLFGYFDGKIDVIELMLKHMAPVETFWIGVQHVGNPEGSWVNEDNQRMNNRMSIPDVDSVDSDDLFLTISYRYKSDKPTTLNVFVRKIANETFPSVCYSIEDMSFF